MFRPTTRTPAAIFNSRAEFIDAELSKRITSILRTQLFDVDADRSKRIDDAIDYFGAGTSTSLGIRSMKTHAGHSRASRA